MGLRDALDHPVKAFLHLPTRFLALAIDLDHTGMINVASLGRPIGVYGVAAFAMQRRLAGKNDERNPASGPEAPCRAKARRQTVCLQDSENMPPT